MQTISISIGLWFKLMKGLRHRGAGVRESGGFLLCNHGKSKVVKIAFYDQFDKSVSESGIIQFKGGAAFFEYLAKEKLEVLADIHTHPTQNTRQSESDMKHPMVRIKGHIAIIAPDYAKDFFIFPKNCSVYKYLGNFEWKKSQNSKFPIHLKLF